MKLTIKRIKQGQDTLNMPFPFPYLEVSIPGGAPVYFLDTPTQVLTAIKQLDAGREWLIKQLNAEKKRKAAQK